ncbi:predicted protein [Streptomyces viridosporus ATCC 14672]|uniref:Predicted protein n=1 Tax=Streptomyces viridosporus (strain ATCC 14672 / DSM 40746 / JCM 4963 / KCTC 9882 / NRRL B-12104 / FH 1290) TaxID=566461 RepID=D6A9W8_STRV1|nr:predicted protein [Streptomyces viridosporus ATCC 14672]
MSAADIGVTRTTPLTVTERYIPWWLTDTRSRCRSTSIRRRRQCPDCSRRFTTMKTYSLMVIKRSGVAEPFNRTKVISSVRKACQGRPVTEDTMAQLVLQLQFAISAGQRRLLESIGLPWRQVPEVRNLHRRGPL